MKLKHVREIEKFLFLQFKGLEVKLHGKTIFGWESNDLGKLLKLVALAFVKQSKQSAGILTSHQNTNENKQRLVISENKRDTLPII